MANRIIPAELFRNGIKIYPLSTAANPPEMEFIEGTGKDFNTVHAANFHFFEELHTVIDREPIEFLDPELRGLFASIGIQKGKPFAPDERMKKILEQAAKLGKCDRTCPVLVRTGSGRVPLRGQLLEAWNDRQLA